MSIIWQRDFDEHLADPAI